MIKLIKDFGADRVGKLKDRLPVPSLSYLIQNDIISQFKDVAHSLDVENLLQSKLKAIHKDFNGLDTLIDLQSEIQDLIRSEDNFRIEKSFTDKLPEILSNIENRLNAGNEYRSTLHQFRASIFLPEVFFYLILLPIAGFTGQGKTFFALNLCLDLAKQKIPIGFISLRAIRIRNQ